MDHETTKKGGRKMLAKDLVIPSKTYCVYKYSSCWKHEVVWLLLMSNLVIQVDAGSDMLLVIAVVFYVANCVQYFWCWLWNFFW